MKGKITIGKHSTIICVVLLSCVVFFILWVTIFDREISIENYQPELFWSYKEWFSGNWKTGKQIIGNIILFIPVGILLTAFTEKRRYLLIPLLFSCTVEILQFLTLRGLFEYDDIFDNTLGALVGWFVGQNIRKKWVPYIVMVVLFAQVIVIITMHRTVLNIPQQFCFQIEEDGTGFFFFPTKNTVPNEYVLMLRNTTTGTKKEIETAVGIDRSELADYFGEEYRFSGFKTTLPDEGEYEVIVRIYPFHQIQTEVYVGMQGVHYAIEKRIKLPDINASFIKNGILRVYCPDNHCWVYQYNGALYWIVDQNFVFEVDGSTYIQYQLWTTQPEKLPRNRLDNNWLWDNIGGNFEDYEIEGDFGEYRVMKRELPTEYSITSIETGYYKDDRWIWQVFFRPIYDF